MMSTGANKQEESRRTENRPALRALFIVALCLAVLFSLAYFALRGFHAWALQGLEDEQRRALKTLAHEPLVVPIEWRNPKPYSTELVDAFAKWEALRSPVGDLEKYPPRLILGQMPDGFAWDIEAANEIAADAATSLSLLTAGDSAAIAAMRGLLRQPDFCLDMLNRPPPHNWVNGQEFTNTHVFLWDLPVVDLVPYDLAARGELTSATEAATELLELTNECMGRSLFLRWHCCQAMARPAFALAYIATHTEDTSHSHRILEQLGKVRPRVLRGGFSRRNLDCDVLYVCELRRIAREGFPVDFETPLTGLGFDRSLDAHYTRYRRQQLQQVLPGDPRRASIEKMSIPAVVVDPDTSPKIAVNPVSRALSRFSAEAAEIRLLFTVYMNSLSVENLPQTWLDLARLRIATHLFFKEKGRHPLSARDLVPGYLPTEPVHPRTGKAYIWDPTKKAFNSGEWPYLYTRQDPSSGRL